MEEEEELFLNARFSKINDKNTNPLSSPCFHYNYSKILCPYRTEIFRASKTENDRVKSLVSRATKNEESSPSSNKTIKDTCQVTQKVQKVIIDTDIGTDCDDVLALLMALRMREEVEIVGVTTNYYPTKLRALIAETIIKASGQNIPVISGCDYVCGTHRSCFLFGNEGRGISLEKGRRERLWKEGYERNFRACNFIYQALQRNPGQIAIVSIGMATNLAILGRIHPDWDKFARHVVIMQGGSFVTTKARNADRIKEIALPKSFTAAKDWARWTPKSKSPCRPVILFPNHNVSGDTLASCLFYKNTTRCPVYVIPHYITAEHWLSKSGAIESLYRMGEKTFEIEAELNVSERGCLEELSDGTNFDREFLSRVDKKNGVVLVMCGTFNPPHQGHLRVLLEAKRVLGDRYSGAIVSLAGDKYAMCKTPDKYVMSFYHRKSLLVAMAKDLGIEHFHISSAEMDVRKLFYVHTIQHFQVLAPEVEFRFCCGTDHGNAILTNSSVKHFWNKSPKPFRVMIVSRESSSKIKPLVDSSKWASWTKICSDAVTILKNQDETCTSMSSTRFRDELNSANLKTVKRALELHLTGTARHYFMRHLFRLLCPSSCCIEEEDDDDDTKTKKENDSENLGNVSGVHVFHWLKRRGYIGQCPHDPLTLYEALYVDPDRDVLNEHNEDDRKKFVPGRSCVRYVRGSIVCHEWAGFMTFVPDPNHGNHYLALENAIVSSSKQTPFVHWLESILVPPEEEEEIPLTMR